MKQKEFLPTVWRGLKPQAVAVAIEFGGYLLIWATVLGAHIVKVVSAAAGIDQGLIDLVSIAEKWVFLATFGSFFWRVLLRLWSTVKSTDL
jgi:hypothetical protein